MPVRRAALLALVAMLAGAPAGAQDAGAPAAGAEPPEPAGGRQRQQLDNVLPRRCGVCHVDKAPAAGAGLLAFLPPSRPGGSGDAAMCYSCHNGIVRDDRRSQWTGRHHPAAGKVSCGSCHTPHVQAADVGLFMRYPGGSYAFCASCHPGRRAGDTGEHPAVAGEKGRVRDCGGCHMAHRAEGDGLIRADSAESLCGPCHGDNPSRAGRGPGMTTHAAGKGGPRCLGCHRVHRTAGGKQLLDNAALDGRLCRQCHERNFSNAPAGANHPVGPGGATCLSCHRMHNAEKPGARRGMLAAAWTEVDAICARCHANVAGAQADGTWNHPLGVAVDVAERPLAEKLARSGAYFSPGAKITCLTCHRPHGAPAGTAQLATTREAICLYCHPAQNSLDPGGAAPGAHPVSVKPKSAKIDPSFVTAGGTVGPGGELTCGTCHRTHRASAGTPGLVLSRTRYSCLLCHRDEASIAETPHSSVRSPKAEKGVVSTGLCGGCHGEHGWRIPVGELAAGRTAIEALCGACHREDGPGPAFGGVTNHPTGVAPPAGRGTAGLPLFWTDGRRFRQGVVTCATCHDVHRAGDRGAFLRKSLAPGSRDLCVGCHAAQAGVAGTPHDVAPAGGSPCHACHAVHDPLAAGGWPAVRGGQERAFADLSDFCGACHRPGGRAAGVQVAEKWHPAPPVAGAKRTKAVGCGGCHDPHRWYPENDADRGTAKGRSPGGKFLVRAVDELCAGCHADQAAVNGTPHDLRGRQTGGSSAAGGQTASRGVCGPCHRAHGEQPLAATARQPKPGANPEPVLDSCEECHAAGKSAGKTLVAKGGHPVGVSPGQDFGPELPLYGATGRRQPGGRIACATCHDPHRWEPPGGSGADSKSATSFLRMGADGYAPLCFPCHAEKSLVVGTDHDLRVTAPSAVNRQGQTAEQSGVCGVCHAIHGGDAHALWNREVGEGRDGASRACSACHRAGNGLGARVPPRTEAHLVNYPGRGLESRVFTVTRFAADGREGIPVFDKNGLRADTGYLTCASCHEVHRWDADAMSSGSGVPVEGDVTNSFLRVRATALDRTLCGECHGDSLVERYRNYHFPEGR